MKNVMSDKSKSETGRGKGSKENYLPWIRVHEVTGRGVNHRPYGWKTRREHQLLSKLEFEVFLAFEWDDDIEDIREQFPLNQVKTVNIANDLDIKHPSINNEPIVMTTDFLLTVNGSRGEQKFVARTVKEAKELEDKRTLEKLEIERIYFRNLGIDWGIITDKDINREFTANMVYIHNSKSSSSLYGGNVGLLETMIDKCRNYLERYPDRPLIQNLNNLDREMNSEKGDSLSLVKFMIANKIVNVDMFEEINVRKVTNEILTWGDSK